MENLRGIRYNWKVTSKYRRQRQREFIYPTPQPKSKSNLDLDLSEFLENFTDTLEDNSDEHTIDAKMAGFRVRPWHRIDGIIEFPMMARFIHGIYVHIQQSPGVTFKTLVDLFGAPLDKCSLMDILVYLEVNGAIARHK